MVVNVGTHVASRFVSNALGDFHFASQYLAIAHIPKPSNTNAPKRTALLLTLVHKCFVTSTTCVIQATGPMANRLTGCSVRLQCWLNREYTGKFWLAS